MAQKQKGRGTPKRPAKKIVSRSTALVRRKPTRVEVLPAEGAASTLQLLSDGPMMTAAFVGTLKLSEAQIAALRRPVDDREVEWKPLKRDGPPAIPYLSHNGYRDRLDAAFGLGGWGMVPVGMPKEKDGVVYVPYALVIEGVPRVYAWGEQAYHENNGQMSYGDALEGAKSNAILRCGKELGIAREMWNRNNLAELKQRLQPAAARSREFYGGERGGKQERQQQSAPRAEEYHGHHAKSGEPITEKQDRRLWVIVRNSGRDEQQVRRWLERFYRIRNSAELSRADYDEACRLIEYDEDLPERTS